MRRDVIGLAPEHHHDLAILAADSGLERPLPGVEGVTVDAAEVREGLLPSRDVPLRQTQAQARLGTDLTARQRPHDDAGQQQQEHAKADDPTRPRRRREP